MEIAPQAYAPHSIGGGQAKWHGHGDATGSLRRVGARASGHRLGAGLDRLEDFVIPRACQLNPMWVHSKLTRRQHEPNRCRNSTPYSGRHLMRFWAQAPSLETNGPAPYAWLRSFSRSGGPVGTNSRATCRRERGRRLYSSGNPGEDRR